MGTLCCGLNKHRNQPAPEANPPQLPPPHTPRLHSSKTHRVCKRKAQRHKRHIISSFNYDTCLKQWRRAHTKDSKGRVDRRTDWSCDKIKEPEVRHCSSRNDLPLPSSLETQPQRRVPVSTENCQQECPRLNHREIKIFSRTGLGLGREVA